MDRAELAQTIDNAFDNRDEVTFATQGVVRDAVNEALELMDRGEAPRGRAK